MAGGAVLAAPGRADRRPGRAWPAAPVPDFGPEKMLPKKFETPLPEDWAWDWAWTAAGTQQRGRD